MKIHKEGIRIVYSIWAILILLILVIGRFYSWEKAAWFLPLLLIGIFVSRFFRIPNREFGQESNVNFYAPADGKIVSVEKIKWNNTEYNSISIFMSIWNVHINWIPVTGSIQNKKYNPGKFLMAANPKSSSENERSSVEINTDNGLIKITQVAGAVARRIITYPTLNQNVNPGEQLGFIKFGSRVDILLPTTYIPAVKIGDKVIGMNTILAKLN